MASKLFKKGFEWKKVSELFAETPPVTANHLIKDKFPGYEGLWCKLIMAVTSAAMMESTVAIIHGPENCAWAVRNFTSTNYALYYGNPFLHMPCTNINSNDVVMGGSEKLEDTILKVDRDYKPQHICVFDTCSTALIGDDTQGVVNSVQSQCQAKVTSISSAGFVSPMLGKSIQESSVQYTNMMETPVQKIENSVNILGQYKEQHDGKCKKGKSKRGKYPDDAAELVRFIEALGLNVHRVLISGGIDYIKSAPEAMVNVISCPTWGLPLAKKMQDRFEVPYLDHSVPLGIETTCAWIRDLAKFFGKEEQAELFIQKEIEEIKPLFERVKTLVSGKTALIECGRNSQTAFARPMARARMLQELGMKPYLFGLHPLELKAKDVDVEYFLKYGFDPMVLSGNYAYQQPVNIADITEDLSLAENDYMYFTEDVFPMARAGNFDSSSVAKVETGVHLRRVIDAPGRGVGFRGTKAMLESMLDALVMAQRKQKPTLYGRVHGQFYEFEDDVCK